MPAQYFRQVTLHIASLELEGRSIVKELCKFDILFDILSITTQGRATQALEAEDGRPDSQPSGLGAH